MVEYARALLVADDTEGYGGGSGERREAARAAFGRLRRDAGRASGLRRDAWWRRFKGHGEPVVPPSAAGSLAVDDRMKHLDTGLMSRNATLPPEGRIRLRAAIHRRVAYPASRGPVGGALVEVGRLIGRKQIESAGENVKLILVVSRRVFSGVMSQGRTTYDPEELLKVHVKEKDLSGAARVWAPRLHLHDLGLLVSRRPSGDGCPSSRRSSGYDVLVRRRPSGDRPPGPVDARRAALGAGSAS